jgi:hypothetical protein
MTNLPAVNLTFWIGYLPYRAEEALTVVFIASMTGAVHNPSMADRQSRDRPARRHRVLIEDARRNGHHLRVTWHPDKLQFVVSTWSLDVCTGSARLAVGDVADLTSLLVDGLTEAATVTAVPAAAVPPTRPGAAGLLDRLRWLVRGTPPPGPRSTPRAAGRASAPVRPLRHLGRRSA